MKRIRLFALVLLTVLAFGLASCTRSVSEDLSQKGQVLQRDMNHIYDTFSKMLLNHDPNDPYLD